MSQPAGLIICLNDVTLDRIVGPVEVLIQEGFTTFALAASSENIATIIGMFGPRAMFGAHAVFTAEDVDRCVDAGAGFVLSDVASLEIAERAQERDVPIWLAAMTPTEIRRVLEMPVAGALVTPADVLGPEYAKYLKTHGFTERLIPKGGLGAFSATEWRRNGVRAACVDETMLGDALEAGDLGKLRDRCGSFKRVF